MPQSKNLDDKTYLGPIDPEARMELEELQQPGEENLYQAILTVYLRDSAIRVKMLNDYASEKNNGSIDPVKIAHSWKSSSYSVGAKQLSDFCAQLEGLAPSQRDEQIILIEKIKNEYHLVKTALEKQTI